MSRAMTDREVLFFAYGALRALVNSSAREAIKIVEEHLYPPTVQNKVNNNAHANSRQIDVLQDDDE